jgi:hypothetical protein
LLRIFLLNPSLHKANKNQKSVPQSI